MGEHCSDTRIERSTWRAAPGLGGRIAAAGVVSFLLFGPYLANVSRDYTRFCYFWRTGDTVTLILLVIGLAAGLWLAGEFVRRTGKSLLIRLAQHAWLSLFGLGLLGNLVFAAPKLGWKLSAAELSLLWALLLLTLGYSFGNVGCRLISRCRWACQIAWPAVPLTFLGLLIQKGYPEQCDRLEPVAQPCAAQGTRQGGRYVFVFDEWSYDHTFRGGEVLDQYPNLAAFARSATVYHDAHAPGGCTEESMPGILFQTGAEPWVRNGQFEFVQNGSSLKADQHQSLFARMALHGYRTAMVGYGLPYRLWLGEQVELCRSYCYYARGADLWSQAGVHLFNTMRYLPDCWSRKWYKRMEQQREYALIRSMLSGADQDVQTILRDWPAETFLFAHLHLPHMPALLNPDLSFRTAGESAWHPGDKVGYLRNLAAMDTMLGKYMRTLREQGKYEDATIVLTSDHGWRSDPDRAAGIEQGPITRVPLLVKAPRQRGPASVNIRFETSRLGELVESLVGSKPSSELLVVENRR